VSGGFGFGSDEFWRDLLAGAFSRFLWTAAPGPGFLFNIMILFMFLAHQGAGEAFTGAFPRAFPRAFSRALP